MPMLGDVMLLYRDRFMQVPTERRRKVFQLVKYVVENLDSVSFYAFLPFILVDDNRAIV
jgi:hypothetical protein